jgi:hypothetical protein
VDTQLLLWNVYGSRKLPTRVARLFRDALEANGFHELPVAGDAIGRPFKGGNKAVMMMVIVRLF